MTEASTLVPLDAGVFDGGAEGLEGELLHGGVAAPAENAVPTSNDPNPTLVIASWHCPLDVLTTVDLDHLAGDVPGPVRAQKGHQVGALLG